MNLIICSPATSADFEAYFNLRYELLRKPWKEAKGSEKDDQEDSSFHVCAKYNNEIVGACRLQFLDEQKSVAQIRYMCTSNKLQGKGIGKKMLEFAEAYAFENLAQKVILHSRESAVNFYKKCGYTVIEPSYLLFGCIPHFLMEKSI